MRKAEREIKDKQAIKEIIQKADACRIALVDENNMPYIVAMNFGYKEGNLDCLYFHCANEGKKIDIIKLNNAACFQMDVDHKLIIANKACGYTMKYKSVVGFGKIHIVETNEEKIEGLNCVMSQYSDRTDFTYEDKMLACTTILRLDIESITGKGSV